MRTIGAEAFKTAQENATRHAHAALQANRDAGGVAPPAACHGDVAMPPASSADAPSDTGGTSPPATTVTAHLLGDGPLDTSVDKAPPLDADDSSVHHPSSPRQDADNSLASFQSFPISDDTSIHVAQTLASLQPKPKPHFIRRPGLKALIPIPTSMIVREPFIACTITTLANLVHEQCAPKGLGGLMAHRVVRKGQGSKKGATVDLLDECSGRYACVVKALERVYSLIIASPPLATEAGQAQQPSYFLAAHLNACIPPQMTNTVSAASIPAISPPPASDFPVTEAALLLGLDPALDFWTSGPEDYIIGSLRFERACRVESELFRRRMGCSQSCRATSALPECSWVGPNRRGIQHLSSLCQPCTCGSLFSPATWTPTLAPGSVHTSAAPLTDGLLTSIDSHHAAAAHQLKAWSDTNAKIARMCTSPHLGHGIVVAA